MAAIECSCEIVLALGQGGKAIIVDLSACKGSIAGCEVDDPHAVVVFNPKSVFDADQLAQVELFRAEWLTERNLGERCDLDVSKPFGKLHQLEGAVGEFVLAARCKFGAAMGNVEQRRPNVSLKKKEAKGAKEPQQVGEGKPKKEKREKPKPVAASPVITGLVDIDANLLHAELIGEVAALRRSAKAAGVAQLVVPACTLDDSRQSLALAASEVPSDDQAEVFATVGIHPHHVPADSALDECALAEAVRQLEEMARNPLCRAVGECGLDNSEGSPPAASQRAYFAAQVELAVRLGLPLFLHERDAAEAFLEVLDVRGFAPAQSAAPPVPVVVHCFTSDRATLEAFVARGFYIGVTGFIIRKNQHQSADDLKQGLQDRIVPLDRLMIETDAPYMGFKGCRKGHAVEPKGKFPNLPSALPQILAAVAECMCLPQLDLAKATAENSRRFFKLPASGGALTNN